MRKLLKTEISNNREQMLAAACLLITRPAAGEPGAVALMATAHNPCASVSGTGLDIRGATLGGRWEHKDKWSSFFSPWSPHLEAHRQLLGRWYLDMTLKWHQGEDPRFCPQGPGRGPGIISSQGLVL